VLGKIEGRMAWKESKCELRGGALPLLKEEKDMTPCIIWS